MTHNSIKFVFFGTPEFAVLVLEELKKQNIIPALVVTAPDKPKGRKLILTPPPVKVWAVKHKIQFLQPEVLDENFNQQLTTYLPAQTGNPQLFIVAAYGKILPKELLAIPKYGTLNVHPSLLPKHRGASPIEHTILSGDKETGVTIMLLDEKMDHGPIVAQEKIFLIGTEKASELEEKLAHIGGELLAEVIPKWTNEEIEVREQDHSQATYTKKIKKEDGLINLEDDPVINWRKIRAYDVWPGTYFFTKNKSGKEIRVIIKEAELKDSELIIKKVLPEGRKEISYSDFLKGLNSSL